MTFKTIPKIGLGTWKLLGEECTSVVLKGLEIGYRHIDTAFNYQNQKDVGKAIQGWNRSDLFVTSKVVLSQGDFEEVCHTCLKDLNTDYLDLYLMHWPDRSVPITAILEKVQKLQKDGKILQFGVSNFTVRHLQDWIKEKAPICCHQFELHPYLYQKELVDFCKEQSIQVVAHRPLGKGALLQDSTIASLAKKYGKTPSQIILSWIFSKDIAAVAKASSFEHLKENWDSLSLQMQKEDLFIIDSLHKNQRFCKTDWADFDYT